MQTDNTELVERLRASIAQLDAGNAADELARLQAENARLRTLGEGMANG